MTAVSPMRTISGAVAGLLLATPGVACEAPPADHVPAVLVDGSQCSVQHNVNDLTAIVAELAEDLGEGLVVQTFTRAEWCGDKGVTAVMDCNSGKSVVFGDAGVIWGLSGPDEHEEGTRYFALRDAVTPSSRAGWSDTYKDVVSMQLPSSFGVDDVQSEANRLKMPVVDSLNTVRTSMNYEGYNFDLSCGCRTFYPQAKGVSQ